MRTYTAKSSDAQQRDWWVVDASGQTLGRLATGIARVLRGKHKPMFTQHLDCGDHVIVINADKIRVTGNKLDQIVYYRHSGYPDGLRSITLRDQLRRHPTRVIEHAVRGMLPKNRLGRQMIKKLKVYASDTHPHQAQQPKVMDLQAQGGSIREE